VVRRPGGASEGFHGSLVIAISHKAKAKRECLCQPTAGLHETIAVPSPLLPQTGSNLMSSQTRGPATRASSLAHSLPDGDRAPRRSDPLTFSKETLLKLLSDTRNARASLSPRATTRGHYMGMPSV
jgi:hypothetical protein